MKLIISRRALRDMTAIGRYIAMDNPIAPKPSSPSDSSAASN